MSMLSKIFKMVNAKLLIALLAAGGNVILAVLAKLGNPLSNIFVAGIAVVTIFACLLVEKNG